MTSAPFILKWHEAMDVWVSLRVGSDELEWVSWMGTMIGFSFIKKLTSFSLIAKV